LFREKSLTESSAFVNGSFPKKAHPPGCILPARMRLSLFLLLYSAFRAAYGISGGSDTLTIAVAFFPLPSMG
jgi:hypothetical protein